MKLHEDTRTALERWLSRDTWYKREHPTDMHYFFNFVDNLRRDIRTLDGKEGELLDLMRETLRRLGWRGAPEQRDSKLRAYISDIWMILDFLGFCNAVGTLKVTRRAHKRDEPVFGPGHPLAGMPVAVAAKIIAGVEATEEAMKTVVHRLPCGNR